MNWLQNFLDTFRILRSSMSDSPDAWLWSITRFEAADRVSKPPVGVVVFAGSSSITYWDSLVEDMAPLPVINRGFGGSKIHQVTHFVDRIITPYHPSAVVLFAGINDIAGSKPKTAQEILEGYREFIQSVRGVPVYYIGITPAPSSWNYWPIASEANRLINAFTSQDQSLHFIDLTDQLLTSDGMPDLSLYRSDKRHLNKKGYGRWTAVIKPILSEELGSKAAQVPQGH